MNVLKNFYWSANVLVRVIAYLFTLTLDSQTELRKILP